MRIPVMNQFFPALAFLGLAVLMAWPAWPQGAANNVNNVVILLDASGSMREKMGASGDTRMEAAKAALSQVLTQIPDSTHVGLLTFSSLPELRWPYPLGPRDDARLNQAMARLQPSGGTPLGAYLKLAAERLLEAREAQFGYGAYRLLVVTDGEANDQALVERFTPLLLSRGIVLDVIGVDMRQDHTLAAKAHSYRRADDPEGLARALSEIFAEVSNANGAQDGDIEFALLEGFPAEVAMAALAALSEQDNSPLAEDARAGRTAPIPAPAAPAAVPGPAPGKVAGISSNLPMIMAAAIGVIIVVRVLKRVLD